MTDAEFWALPPEKRDEFLSACEAGWDAANEWREECRSMSRHVDRAYLLLCVVFAMMVLTNMGWIGALYLAASRVGGAQ